MYFNQYFNCLEIFIKYRFSSRDLKIKYIWCSSPTAECQPNIFLQKNPHIYKNKHLKLLRNFHQILQMIETMKWASFRKTNDSHFCTYNSAKTISLFMNLAFWKKISKIFHYKISVIKFFLEKNSRPKQIFLWKRIFSFLFTFS